MNPRIKEIALQAGGSHYPEVGGEKLERFAELLIEDILKVTFRHQTDCGCHQAIRAIYGKDTGNK